MATEISNRRSIFILFFSVTVFLNSCGLLFADSCDSHELDPESFSWESRMLCWLGLLVFWALVNVALGVSFHIFKTWEAADPLDAPRMCQGGYLHGASQGRPPWACEELLAAWIGQLGPRAELQGILMQTWALARKI